MGNYFSSKGMLRYAVYLMVVIVAAFACRRSVEPVSVVIHPPEVTGQSGQESNARLLGLRIEGIPDRNITLDSVTKVVTVIVPTDISTISPAVSYSVTSKATASPVSINFLTSQDIRLTVDAPGQAYKQVSYKVVLKPAGDMTIGNLQTPFVYETGDILRLPVLNFYDGTYSGTKLVLTRKDGSEKTELYVYNYNSTIVQVSGGPEQVNVFWPVISQSNLKPGEYTAELIKENGRKASINQPLVVKRGVPRLRYPGSNVITSLQRDTIAVGGANLFADEQITVLITDSKGRQITAKPVQYDADGHWLRFLLPATLPAGYHALQLIKDGKPLSDYNRLIVIKEADQPYITGIETYVFNPANPNDLILERNRQYSFEFGYYCGKSMQLRLTSLTTPDREFSVDPIIPATLCTNGYGIPAFILPNTVPPGRYNLSFRSTANLGSSRVVESEPFEKIIDVR